MVSRLPQPPTVIPARQDRFGEEREKIRELQSLLDVVDRKQRKKPPRSEILPKLSDEQLRVGLGQNDEFDVETFRRNPDDALSIDPVMAERLDDLAVRVERGEIEGENEDNTNIFLNALDFISEKTPLSYVFRALDMYDRNIAKPFAGGAVFALQQLLPGEQEVEKKFDQLLRDGVRADRAFAQAFEDSTFPGWVKAGIQFFADPAIIAGAAIKVARGAFVGTRALTTLTSAEQTGRVVFKMPTVEKLTASMGAQETSRLKEAIKYIDRSATTRPGTPESALIGHAGLQEVGQGFAEIGIANVNAIGNAKQLFKFNKGTVEIGGKKMTWDEAWARTTGNKNPLKMNADQFSYMTESKRLVGSMEKMLKEEGFSPKKIKFTPKDNFPDPLDDINEYLIDGYNKIAGKRLVEELDNLGLIKRNKRGGIPFSPQGARFKDDVVGKKVRDALSDNGIKPLEKAGKLNDLIRTLRTSFDFGAPFIQGLPLLFTRPTLWGKVTLGHYQAFLDKGFRSRYIRQNSDTVAEFIENGGVIGSTEFFESLKSGGWLAKLPPSVRDRTFVPFNRSFDTFLDVSKVELYKALRETAIRTGQQRELASHVNHMLGTISSKSLGLSATQRQLERSLIMFSPRYTRASAALVLDMFKGGLRAREAQKAMASMLVAGSMAHRAFAEALGQEANLDPISGTFMKVKIGDTWVGPGGKFRSLLRVFAKTTERTQQHLASRENPFLNWNMFDKEDFGTNPMLQWLRSNASPASNLAMNLALGVDGIGRDIPLEDGTGWADFAGEEFTPFFLQAALEGGEIAPRGGRAATEIIGLMSQPESERDKLFELYDKVANEEFGVDWQDLPVDQKTQLRLRHPEIQEQEERKEKESQQFSTFRHRTEYFKSIDRADENWTRLANQAADEWASGVQGDNRGLIFRRKMKEANRIRQRERELAAQNYPDVIESFKDGDTGEREAFDLAIDEYLTIIFGPDGQDEFGNPDYTKIDQLKVELEEKWGSEIINRVEGFLDDKRLLRGELHPVVTDYFDALETVRPYWELWKDVFEGENRRTWAMFEGLSGLQQENLLKGFSPLAEKIRILQRQLNREKVNLRRNNAEIDAALVKYWDTVPRHRDNQNL